jgi:hypothetical protein
LAVSRPDDLLSSWAVPFQESFLGFFQNIAAQLVQGTQRGE